MNTSIAHLPQPKQEELRLILEAILEIGKPVMVILFGSYARGDWVEDKYIENGTTYEYKSDYDILVVTAREHDTQIGNSKRIKKRVRKSGLVQTPLSLIFHSIDFLNGELSEGNYFFTDIEKEGVLLYDNKQFSLAEARILSPEERTQKAKNYFDVWFSDANGFYRVHELSKSEGLLKQSIFNLHQAAERYYMTVLLVYNDYKPKIHDLEELGHAANIIDARFKLVFPRSTPEEDRLFIVLKKAYIDSRYKLGYTVNPADLEYLAGKVLKLKDLVEEVCEKRIGD